MAEFTATAQDGQKYKIEAGSQDEADRVVRQYHNEVIQNTVNKDPSRELVSSIPGAGDAARMVVQGVPVLGKQDSIMGWPVKDQPSTAQYKEDHPYLSKGMSVAGTVAPFAGTAALAPAMGLGTAGAALLNGAVGGGANLLDALTDKDNHQTAQEVGKSTLTGIAGGALGPVGGALIGNGAKALGTILPQNATVSGMSNMIGGSGLGALTAAAVDQLRGHGFDLNHMAIGGGLGLAGRAGLNSMSKALTPMASGPMSVIPSTLGNTIQSRYTQPNALDALAPSQGQ